MARTKIVNICVLKCLKEPASPTVGRTAATLDSFPRIRCQIISRRRNPKKEKRKACAKVSNVHQREKQKGTESAKVRIVPPIGPKEKRKETDSRLRVLLVSSQFTSSRMYAIILFRRLRFIQLKISVMGWGDGIFKKFLFLQSQRKFYCMK